jgi:hypothetical protein
MATPKEIAEWMLVEYQKFDRLYQNRIANQIRSHFGQEWVYRNKNGNSAIVKSVLDEFRKLTPKDVVWSRSEQFWRKRREHDPPGRMVR